MKNKIIPFLLCTSLMCSNIIAFADETEFNANEAFKSYASFDDSQVNESWKHYYIVSKSNDDNSKALFSEGEQLTDFIYNSIDTSGYAIIVSQKKDNTEYFGLISDEDYKELLPVKYKSIEDYEVIGYIAENIDSSKEYYIVKTPVNEAPNNVDYKETDKLYILNSYDDLKTTLGISESEPTLTPIEGLDNCYVMDDVSGFYQYIVDKDGNKLIDTNFRKVDTKLSPGNTLLVWYPAGMQDSRAGLLSKDFKTIVPKNSYSHINFITSNNQIYVEAESCIDGSFDYYDLNGNKVNAPNSFESIDNSYSKWAEESIKNSIELGLVPENLQYDYTDKITRGEFCQLAVQTYITKTGNEINMNVETPFTDVNDAYITTAYNLKIVSGVGDDKFAPDNYITRQEAAVMLNNLASVLNIDNSTPQSEKFVDESYFADWAKAAIYKVAGIKSGDTYVMTGTGDGKFSPWMNYTREQAIATMYRLYKCQNTTKNNNIEKSEKLTITTAEKEEDDVIYPINRLVNESGEVVAEYPYIIDIGCGVYMYKTQIKDGNDIIIKAGLLNSKGEIIVNSEYDDITTYAFNNTITLKKDNTFYIYDNLGNLKKSIDYNLSADGTPYEVVEATGSNIIVRQYVNKLWMVGIQPDQDYYIYRLYSQQKAADDYFNIRAIDNGEFIANDVNDKKICILDANGNFKKKTNYSTIYRLDKGLYCAKEEYDEYQDISDLESYHKQQSKIAFLDDKFSIIEELENVEFEIDRDNRIVKAESLGIPVEISY